MLLNEAMLSQRFGLPLLHGYEVGTRLALGLGGAGGGEFKVKDDRRPESWGKGRR